MTDAEVPAVFDAREIASEVLVRDRALMDAWKEASARGGVEAVTVAGRNYVVVRDAALAARISAAAPRIRRHRWDESTRTLR